MRNNIIILLQILVVVSGSFFLTKLISSSSESPTNSFSTTSKSWLQASDQALEMSTASVPKAQSTTMSPADFRLFNRLAEQMTMYHSILRKNWDELYSGTAQGSRKPSPFALISLGMQFCQHLKGHHDIEEAYWFPVLGKKMKGFQHGGFAKEQHKAMHKGLDVLAAYLVECKRGDRELERGEVRRIMDSFGNILWSHMEQEVVELGGNNMRKFWTKEEMQMFPF